MFCINYEIPLSRIYSIPNTAQSITYLAHDPAVFCVADMQVSNRATCSISCISFRSLSFHFSNGCVQIGQADFISRIFRYVLWETFH